MLSKYSIGRGECTLLKIQKFRSLLRVVGVFQACNITTSSANFVLQSFYAAPSNLMQPTVAPLLFSTVFWTAYSVLFCSYRFQFRRCQFLCPHHCRIHHIYQQCGLLIQWTTVFWLQPTKYCVPRYIARLSTLCSSKNDTHFYLWFSYCVVVVLKGHLVRSLRHPVRPLATFFLRLWRQPFNCTFSCLFLRCHCQLFFVSIMSCFWKFMHWCDWNWWHAFDIIDRFDNCASITWLPPSISSR